MVSGKTPTGTINYTEIARNVNAKIAKVCHGCTTYYKLVLVEFSNTNITYLNQIFQSNENNDKEKRN